MIGAIKSVMEMLKAPPSPALPTSLGLAESVAGGEATVMCASLALDGKEPLLAPPSVAYTFILLGDYFDLEISSAVTTASALTSVESLTGAHFQ